MSIVATDGSTHRTMLGKAALAIAVLFAAFHLATSGLGQLPDLMQRSIHVCVALALAFLMTAGRLKLANAVLAALSLGVGAYMVARYDAMTTIGYYPDRMDLVVGGVTILLVLEAARRVIGIFFPIMAILVILYAVYGWIVPGDFGHRGLGWAYMIEVVFATSRGLWGVITGVSATVIATFVIFGAVLFRTGGGETFMALSLYVGGRQTAGAGKVATIASGFFGSLSGSAAANIATTGAFTIPMMKRLGFSPSFAAGVEASASMGGQLMPPIMGAGAFVMAELLGVSYGSIALAALVPALLFYFGVFATIHFRGARFGYRGLSADEIPAPSAFLAPKAAASLFLPLLILVVMLIQGFTPGYAGFWAIMASITSFTVFSWRSLGPGKIVRELIGALGDAGKGLVMIAVLIACAQIILALIASTGLGVKVAGLVVSLGAASLFLSLLLAMVLAILLGMGLPTTAAYLLAATVIAPALERLGISGVQAHLFIFYYAIAAGITPPLCAGVFIAAAMADADWVETLGHALRISAAALCIPFFFVVEPALLLDGTLFEIAFAIAKALLVILAIAVMFTGYLFAPVPLALRSVLGVAAIFAFAPVLAIKITALAVICLVFAAICWVGRSSSRSAAPREEAGHG